MFYRFDIMKRLLYIIFIFSSLNTFSQDQEKKGICSASVQLFHDNGGSWDSNDHFWIDGFYSNNFSYYGNFQVDSTTWSDTLIYEITLPFGDSLQYTAYWHADGMCYGIDTAVQNHIVSVLEGPVFPIKYDGYYSPGYYDISQEAYISEACLFKIQKGYHGYFFRVKFLDPLPQPEPEKPLTLWEALNELYLWLKNENTISVKAGDATIWEVNLYSLSGQLLQKHQFQGSQDIDISKLPKGCYIAHISPENGKNKQLKFIK